jgi:agmatine deiminase
MIANAGADAAPHGRCAPGAVEIVELPLDDSWLRDSGPIYVVDHDDSGASAGGRRTAVHFGFNAWGEKFTPWDKRRGGRRADRGARSATRASTRRSCSRAGRS